MNSDGLFQFCWAERWGYTGYGEQLFEVLVGHFDGENMLLAWIFVGIAGSVPDHLVKCGIKNKSYTGEFGG